MATGATIASGAENVKRELARRGWTQADLARRLDADKATVTKILKGRLCSPYLQHETACLFGADPETLWGDLWWFPRYRAARRKDHVAIA